MRRKHWKRSSKPATKHNPSLKNASQNPGDAGAIAGLAGAEGLLGGALGRIFALAESYPDLKGESKYGQSARRALSH